MRRDIALSGICGLCVGIVVYASAIVISGRVSFFRDSLLASVTIFGLLVFFALLEIPAMTYAMRLLLHSVSLPRLLVLCVNAIYVAFAAVYASIYLLVTGEPIGGWLLAATSVLRLASGIWTK